MTLLIGIDPGIKYTGWAILSESPVVDVVACDFIQTNPNFLFEERLYQLYLSLNKILNDYSPKICVMEKIFINKNPQSSIILAQTKGALMLVMKIHKIDIIQLDANTIKKMITGDGHASKEKIRYILEQTLKYDFQCKKFDSSDAVAVALSGIYILKK